MDCEFCQKTFSSKYILKNHQKRAKYCLEMQKNFTTEIISDLVKCPYCEYEMAPHHLQRHLLKCKKKLKIDKENEERNNRALLDENINLKHQIEILKAKNEILERSVTEKDTKLQEMAMTAIEQKNEVISSMVKKYVKKQPRKQFECSNVVYILTTSSLKKERRYILGKAKNLTNRLSTYNKTDEHEVIYYQDCNDEESMNALEPLVFKKLSQYREQANRERFILPEDTDIDLFIDTIKSCFEFLK